MNEKKKARIINALVDAQYDGTILHRLNIELDGKCINVTEIGRESIYNMDVIAPILNDLNCTWYISAVIRTEICIIL